MDFMKKGYEFWMKQCGLKAVVRLFHTGLCAAITATLLWKDTELHRALIEGQDPVYGGIFVGTVIVSLILYYVACLTGPGYVDIVQYRQRHQAGEDNCVTIESELSEEETDMHTADSQPLDKRNRYKYRFCDYCEIQPPLRSKHCEDCKQCVRKYDHHCPWLDTCVGERNHKYFWCFLLVTSVLVVWTFVIVWESFISEKSWTDWFHTNLVFFFDAVVLVLCGPVVLGLLSFHTYLMINGLTTWETASRERITYLKYLDDDYNPFDEGCIKNVYYFMCICNSRHWEVLYAKKAKFKDDPT